MLWSEIRHTRQVNPADRDLSEHTTVKNPARLGLFTDLATAGRTILADCSVRADAIVRLNQKDLDYWLDAKNENEAPKFLRPMFEGDRASLKPYMDSGRVRPFVDGQELSPGIRAVPTPGHTRGHTSYAVVSGEQRLLVWGDLVHVAPIQFPDPSVTVTYDSDPMSAEVERTKAFAKSAQDGSWVAAAHIAFPGLGHIRSVDGHFAWIPANYTTVLNLPHD
ncbi:MBL fold metallo-hydrolase [Bradyrhizobium sp. PUT101]|uniref:MBL fold metallo-hydrolase n=1 Tax=Bradyrhizobium sp. PUT101 TaxID=3447427 RepID=UPI003F835085